MPRYSRVESIVAELFRKTIGRRCPSILRAFENTYRYLNYLICRERRFRSWVADNVTRVLIPEEREHFFGYYDKTPWHPTKPMILYHRYVNSPHLELVRWSLENNEPFVIDISTTWNWQQGCMLQWRPGYPDQVVYNILDDSGNLACRVRDAFTRQLVAEWQMPIQTLRADGDAGISLNYRRLSVLRPDYGYENESRNFAPDMPLSEDGLFHVDLRTGESKLLLSLEELAQHQHDPSMTNAAHKVNHAVYAPEGNRLVFMHRWFTPQGKRSRLYTINDDGSALSLLADDGMVSHYSWRGAEQVLAYCHLSPWGDGYYIFDDRSDRVKRVGEGTSLWKHGDGHPSFSPDRQWIVTDSYPDRRRVQTLYLFQTATSQEYPVVRVVTPWRYQGTKRCDLHPRWSPDGQYVSFDSAEDGRRMSILDASNLCGVVP